MRVILKRQCVLKFDNRMAAKTYVNYAGTDNLKCIQGLDPKLQKTIEEIVEKEGYTSYTVEKRKFNTGGGNFLGELIEIDVKGKTVNGYKETSIFSKKKVVIEKIKYACVTELYLRELFFYAELSKIITFLQDHANVPEVDRLKTVKLYGESDKNILIFENLTKKGFKVYERLDTPPLEYIELAIRELAKFHGLSFVIKQNMPEFYEEKIKSLNSPYRFDEDWEGLMRKVFINTANLFEEDKKRKIIDFLPIAIKKMPQYYQNQTSVRCCLNHGDYKTSNVLVKEINGVPAEVIAVDFQILHYGCPIKDFLHFIYSCTGRDFRCKHMNNLKELYYESLRKYLKYFTMDVEVVYPKKEFEDVYKEWLDYGLIMVMYASPFLFAPASGLDVETLTLSELPFNPDKDFEERARGWIDDYIEWGYL